MASRFNFKPRKKPEEIEAHLRELLRMFTKEIIDEGKYLNLEAIREIRKEGSFPVMHFEVSVKHTEVSTMPRERFMESLISGAQSSRDFRDTLFQENLEPNTVFIALERDKHAGIAIDAIIVETNN